MSSSSIPLADAAALRPAAQRTLAVRTVLAASLAAAVVAAALVARHPHTQTIITVPSHSTALVVLDLSASISSDTYARIGATLSSLAQSNGRYGLIVFSDQAYEALPPGTPAADLQPLVRYFTLPAHVAPGFAPTFPVNPWSGAYRRDHIPLRIVGLNPSAQDAALFSRLTHGAPIVDAGTVTPGPHPRNHTPFPWTLVLVTLAVVAGLAANELWGPRLEWKARP